MQPQLSNLPRSCLVMTLAQPSIQCIQSIQTVQGSCLFSASHARLSRRLYCYKVSARSEAQPNHQTARIATTHDSRRRLCLRLLPGSCTLILITSPFALSGWPPPPASSTVLEFALNSTACGFQGACYSVLRAVALRCEARRGRFTPLWSRFRHSITSISLLQHLVDFFASLLELCRPWDSFTSANPWHSRSRRWSQVPSPPQSHR